MNPILLTVLQQKIQYSMQLWLSERWGASMPPARRDTVTWGPVPPQLHWVGSVGAG